MRLGNPVEAVSNAMGAALHRDLPDIDYEDRDWIEFKKTGKDVRIKKTRRPYDDDIVVYVFPQTWGSTALGYGGMGGSAITTAYTVVVNHNRLYCVYFGCSRLAYRVDLSEISNNGHENFLADVKDYILADCRTAATRYK